METTQFQEIDSAPRNWHELAGEAQFDHLDAKSISILACHEYEQNGASE